MTQQTYTDPASGRPYVVDPATGQTRWLDEQPPAPPGVPPVAPSFPSPGGSQPPGPERRPKTVSGIVGLIVAVIGLTLSWVPIVNNVAFVFALISGVLGVIGFIATRPAGRRSGRWLAVSALAVTALTIAVVLASQALYGKAIDTVSKSLDTSVPAAAASSTSDAGAGGQPDGVVKFGTVASFKDGSTLTCSKPAAFRRAEFAAGGEGKPVFLKSTCTFTNRSGKVFDPSGTSGSMTAAGVEGESVYQDDLDAPDNPVLSGKSVTWAMGYGVTSNSSVQLTVSLGFLSYDDVTFVS